MNIKIVTNERKNNHFTCLKKISAKADTLIIVSPFVTNDFSKLLKEMKTIKKIILYTTMQKYDDTAHKVVALYKFDEYCAKQGIDLRIKIDDNLHGKVYLFYNGNKAKGFILTSGNFTEKGLMSNNEYGICVEDIEKQKEMKDILMSINTYDLTHVQLCEIYNKALEFIEKHPSVQPEKFKLNKLMNKKPSATQNGTLKYYLKPVGTSQNPFIEPMVIKENDYLGFSKNPKTMQKGDVLLLHSVGSSSIVGYYVIASDEAVYNKNDDNDRWPWKVEAECHSVKFSSTWWNYDFKTKALIDEFLKLNHDKHITVAGGDTLGGLQWGRDRLQITKEFAQFIIDKISE